MYFCKKNIRILYSRLYFFFLNENFITTCQRNNNILNKISRLNERKRLKLEKFVINRDGQNMQKHTSVFHRGK